MFENIAKLFLVLGTLSLSAGLSGCGGSGGDSGGSMPTPTPVTGSTSYLFYSGSLSAVDPAAPASPITVAAGMDISAQFNQVLAGTYDAATKTVNDMHPYAIVYAKADGKLYKVSALKSSGTPTPMQLSSETTATKICIHQYPFVDYANPDNTQIVYATPGANNICFNSDDVYKMVRLGMSTMDVPVAAKNPVVPLYDWTTGAISGWLVNDAGALKRCDARFANCSASLNLKSIASNVYSNPYQPALNRWLLYIDGALYVYDGNANTLSTEIHNFSGGISGSNGDHYIDAGMYYFLTPNSPKSIYVVPLDGNTAAKALVTDADNIVLLRGSANTLLYSTATEIKAVTKTGGSATATALATGGSPWIVGVSGNHVYYTLYNGTVPTAGVIDDDGSNKSETPNAAWVGIGIGTTWNMTVGSYVIPQQTLFRAEGYNALGAGKGFAGATLRAFTAASRTEVAVLGTLPTDIVQISCFGFVGANRLCAGSNAAQADIFFLNDETTNSLSRVTKTPTKSESPLSW